MRSLSRLTLGAGTACMILSILFEAYGVHMLQPGMQEDLFHVFAAAVRFQVYQGFGLILLGITAMLLPYRKSFHRSALLIIAGVVLFSGSLYLMALTDTRMLGLIAPLGGLSLTAGWLIFTLEVLRKPRS